MSNIKSPYVSCIQRGKFRINSNKKGIDSLIKFDYMGSSEFEFGALPKSLTHIRDKIQNYSGKKFNFFELNSKTIFCFFPDNIGMYM